MVPAVLRRFHLGGHTTHERVNANATVGHVLMALVALVPDACGCCCMATPCPRFGAGLFSLIKALFNRNPLARLTVIVKNLLLAVNWHFICLNFYGSSDGKRLVRARTCNPSLHLTFTVQGG